MNFAAVFHRVQAPWSYALDQDRLMLRIQTGPEVEQVFLHWGDPFEVGILGGAEAWHGQRQEHRGQDQAGQGALFAFSLLNHGMRSLP